MKTHLNLCGLCEKGTCCEYCCSDGHLRETVLCALLHIPSGAGYIYPQVRDEGFLYQLWGTFRRCRNAGRFIGRSRTFSRRSRDSSARPSICRSGSGSSRKSSATRLKGTEGGLPRDRRYPIRHPSGQHVAHDRHTRFLLLLGQSSGPDVLIQPNRIRRRPVLVSRKRPGTVERNHESQFDLRHSLFFLGEHRPLPRSEYGYSDHAPNCRMAVVGHFYSGRHCQR